MKKLLMIFVGAVLPDGCVSYCDISRNDYGAKTNDGEEYAAFYAVYNVSYRLFGFIPWTTGIMWQDGAYENANDPHVNWFEDRPTLDENMKSVRRAMQEVGATRVAELSSEVEDDCTWSMDLFGRHSVLTTCTLLK